MKKPADMANFFSARAAARLVAIRTSSGSPQGEVISLPWQEGGRRFLVVVANPQIPGCPTATAFGPPQHSPSAWVTPLAQGNPALDKIFIH
jgi:hypothetical protein